MINELGIKIVKLFALDKKLLRFSKEQKIAKELSTIHSTANKDQLYREYLGRKIGYTLLGILCTVIIFLMIVVMPENDSELNGNAIVRNGYDGTEKSVILIAKSEGLEDEIEILVEPLHYTKEQLDVMAEEVFSYFSNKIFIKEKLNHTQEYVVNQHMKFITELDGYPFIIAWESDNYEVLDNDGTIMENIPDSGTVVCVTAKLSCYEYVWEKEYILRIYPVEKDWEDKFVDEMQKTIEELDDITSEKNELLLPQEIEGHKVVYEEKKESSFGVLICLSFIVLILLWFSMDNNVSKQVEDRNKQLLGDYAKLVSKLSLYLGAGLSFRTAVTKIVKSADKNRFYAKELEVVMRELENGIAENVAVERYADRCKLPCYIKLSVLINQNIRKGNNNLQKQLKEEADKAFEEQKYLARKYAEEAGTKLLFPMLLMLLVVMVMIMYPAFISFTV